MLLCYFIISDLKRETMSIETALIFDSVFLFTEAMQLLKGRQFHPVKLKCTDDNSWKNGLTILNTMNTVKIKQDSNKYNKLV